MPVFLALSAAAALPIAQWLIYYFAPVEEQMGLLQKIFYLHLPLAWWALASFGVVFASSVLYLLRRKELATCYAQAAAEIGVILAGLALITGMIWGRQAWGVWWTWDPRLATTLVMWFLYTAYLLLRGMNWEIRRKNAICAVFGILAFLDVPLVFFSARIFRTIHPAVFGNPGGGLDPDMRTTALACVLASGLLWGAILLLRARQLDLERRIQAISDRIACRNQ